jgi:hypothetical protein
MKDVFGIQEEISRSIVDALRIQLAGEHQAPLVTRTSNNFEAYHFYLQGRYHWKKLTEQGLQKAVECFEAAIAQDPKYAQAHAGSSYAYSLAGFYGALNPKKLMAKAKAAAVAAVELDDTRRARAGPVPLRLGPGRGRARARPLPGTGPRLRDRAQLVLPLPGLQGAVR